MKIVIEFYASLMKYLPPGGRRFRRDIKVDEGLKLKQLIEQYNISDEEAHIVLVNGHFVALESREDHVLVEDDVVSIWPPVAGG
ncbi:MAG: MoaD/ThiS family protein [Gammaproteobacteria bacterium]|nr:MoaD/ThiS family protein [Gammaproteobacteria bacterium]